MPGSFERSPAYGSLAADALVALGDLSRQAIVERLAEGPLAVRQIADQLPISRPAVSQHLKVLLDAGLVMSRPVGTRRMYYLQPAGVEAIRAYLDRFWTDALRTFAAFAEDTAPAHPPLYPPDDYGGPTH